MQGDSRQLAGYLRPARTRPQSRATVDTVVSCRPNRQALAEVTQKKETTNIPRNFEF